MTQVLVRDFAPLTLTPLPTLMVPVMQALAQPDTYLALNEGLSKAVVIKKKGSNAEGHLSVDRERVDDLLDWGYITQVRSGAIALYEATETGRATTPAELDRRSVFAPTEAATATRESPVRILARKKGPDGKPYLNADHVNAAGILSEDFLLAGFEENPVGSMEELVHFKYAAGTNAGVIDAHQRLKDALEGLGPDLGDIALRCCCLGEGVETAEKRMGWSARSGKIVLRIALRRLVMHYEKVGADMCYVS